MTSDPQPALNQALDSLWARFLPEMRERVAVLETAAAAFALNDLPLGQHQAANRAAHKLAGVLGTFGLTRGTVLARELEIMYSRENGPDRALAARLSETAAELRKLIEGRTPSAAAGQPHYT
jgi:HPt (histidine-containing phosphotransfer) domain-containing protein